MNKILRNIERRAIKSEIEVLLGEMNISKRVFKKQLPKVAGRGYTYYVAPDGRQTSLRQKVQFLRDLKKFTEEQKALIAKESEQLK